MSFQSVVKEIEILSQEEGYKDNEIAKRIGCSRATVNRERIKHQIPTANLLNRKDKQYVCQQCHAVITIRRKDRKKAICPGCKTKG